MCLLYCLTFWGSTHQDWECRSDLGAESQGGCQLCVQLEGTGPRLSCKQTSHLGHEASQMLRSQRWMEWEMTLRDCCSKTTVRESQGGHLGCGAKTYHRMETTYHLLELPAGSWASEKENWVRNISWPCSQNYSSWALWDMPSLKVRCA